MTAKNARVFRGTLSTVFTTLVAPITVGLVIHTTQPSEKSTGDPVPTEGRLHVVGQDVGWTRPWRDAQPWDRDGQTLADTALRDPRAVLGQTGLGRIQDWPRGQPFYQETVTVTVVRKALAERQGAQSRAADRSPRLP